MAKISPIISFDTVLLKSHVLSAWPPKNSREAQVGSKISSIDTRSVEENGSGQTERHCVHLASLQPRPSPLHLPLRHMTSTSTVCTPRPLISERGPVHGITPLNRETWSLTRLYKIRHMCCTPLITPSPQSNIHQLW